MRTALLILLAAGGVAAYGAAVAADKADRAPARAEVLQKLIDCRAVRVDADRLACYETQAARIDAAEAKRDIVVIDREQATKARKDGFGLPAKGLVVGGAAAPGEGVSDVTSTIRAAKLLPSNRWLFTLADGARWYQAELKTIGAPKPGEPIRIRKGALGGYLANIGKRAALRVRRIDQP